MHPLIESRLRRLIFLQDPRRGLGCLGCALASLSLLTGCGREQIQVYEVPKEKPFESASPTPASPASVMSKLNWSSLPEGWTAQELGGGMRAASFSIQGQEGKRAELTVIPFPGMGGSDLEFVNMWRKQIGLSEISEDGLARHLSVLQIGEQQGKLFDMRGSEGGKANDPNGVLVAVLVRDGVTWFFKLSGDESLVLAQRGSLESFLKGVSFSPSEGTTPLAASTGPSPAGSGTAEINPRAVSSGKNPSWKVPATWQEASPGPMVLAKFIASGDGAARADITVSSFPGDVGGLMANVNRWRTQVGLSPMADSDASGHMQPFALGPVKGTVVDFSGTDSKTGQPARLVGVVVPREEETWFYKLMGHPEVASREKEAFLQFVQSVRYSNVP